MKLQLQPILLAAAILPGLGNFDLYTAATAQKAWGAGHEAEYVSARVLIANLHERFDNDIFEG